MLAEAFHGITHAHLAVQHVVPPPNLKISLDNPERVERMGLAL